MPANRCGPVVFSLNVHCRQHSVRCARCCTLRHGQQRHPGAHGPALATCLRDNGHAQPEYVWINRAGQKRAQTQVIDVTRIPPHVTFIAITRPLKAAEKSVNVCTPRTRRASHRDAYGLRRAQWYVSAPHQGKRFLLHQSTVRKVRSRTSCSSFTDLWDSRFPSPATRATRRCIPLCSILLSTLTMSFPMRLSSRLARPLLDVSWPCRSEPFVATASAVRASSSDSPSCLTAKGARCASVEMRVHG
jgi:hypothetical protein